MAQVSTITIGADVFSVYALTADPVADADSYFAARIGEVWSAATTLQKQQALVSAVRWMDRAVLWSGTKTLASQPLEWPRDNATCRGEAVPNGTIPDAIALGEFELAHILLADAAAQDSGGQGSNVKSVKAGSAAVEFFQPTIGTGSDVRLPTVAWDLVGCYSEGATGLGGAFTFGTDESSSFDDCEQFGRDEGFA